MKESVVDIHDLQEAAPFFKSRFGSFLGKVLIKWLSIDKVNKAHAQDRKSTRLNSSHMPKSRMPSSA